jgi:hypothetical protein
MYSPHLYSTSRQILPISAHRTQILYSLETYGVIVLVGETGCGKSTQLPQYFWENGWADNVLGDTTNYKEIICTQPRRIAAITLTNRLQTELPDPSLVGYSVRFDSTYQPGITKIRYVTDGWLLREVTLLNPLLKHCSVLIIDEAHERSVNTDLLLGTVKKIRRVRPDLRVVVCSATLDAEAFLEFFVGKKKKDKVEDDKVDTAKRKRSRWGRVHDEKSAKAPEEVTHMDCDVYIPKGRVYCSCGYFPFNNDNRKGDQPTVKDSYATELKKIENQIQKLREKKAEIKNPFNLDGIKISREIGRLQRKAELTAGKLNFASVVEPDKRLLRFTKDMDVGLTKEGGVCCKVEKAPMVVEYHILGCFSVSNVEP